MLGVAFLNNAVPSECTVKVVYVSLVGKGEHKTFYFNLQPVKHSHAPEIYEAMKEDSVESKSQ